MTAQLDVRPPDATRPVRTLSGGNQQKVVLARWLLQGCDVLLLDEPTRGVDVGARSEIYALVRRLADSGVAVVLVSSEVPEVLGLADRVLVVREGRVVHQAPERRARREPGARPGDGGNRAWLSHRRPRRTRARPCPRSTSRAGWSGPPARPRPAANPLSRLLDSSGPARNLGLVAVLVLLGIVGVATADTFLTRSNLLTILTSASVIGVITVGVTMVIIGGGIDLSVGKVMALASVWATTVATQSYGPVVMVFCALAVGAGRGLVNGLLIAYGRIVPFIVTLAMLISAQGLAEQISGRRSQIVTDPTIAAIANTRLLGIPLLVYIFAAVVAVGWVVLNRTTFGRRTFAIGGNPEAARLAGLDVRRHTVALYVVSGLCCGIAAIMIASLTTTGSSTHGTLYELDAIAAVIIGGTLLSGGRGTLIGSILGVLVFTTITNLFVLNNLATEVQNIAKGAIIVAAVLIQSRARRSSYPPPVDPPRRRSSPMSDPSPLPDLGRRGLLLGALGARRRRRAHRLHQQHPGRAGADRERGRPRRGRRQRRARCPR